MCLGPNAQPVGQGDQVRGWQLMGSVIKAGQGDQQARQNLATWRANRQAAGLPDLRQQPQTMGG